MDRLIPFRGSRRGREIERENGRQRACVVDIAGLVVEKLHQLHEFQLVNEVAGVSNDVRSAATARNDAALVQLAFSL